jgi:hypothetical protein
MLPALQRKCAARAPLFTPTTNAPPLLRLMAALLPPPLEIPDECPRKPAEPRLTSLSHGGGCGCKIAPGVL